MSKRITPANDKLQNEDADSRQQRLEVLASMQRIWASMPVVEDIAAAEQDILEEIEAYRNEQRQMR